MAHRLCACGCHQTKVADAHRLRHVGLAASAYVMELDALEHPEGVDVRDFVACVFACSKCRVYHSPVLDPEPKIIPPWEDPPRQPPPPATGCGDDEGSE